MRSDEPDFLWDDDDDPNGNVAHIAEHGVTPTEAEDAILDPQRVPTTFAASLAESACVVMDAILDPQRVPTTARRITGRQRRRAIVGATRNGRILVVVYVVQEGAYRVITAYEAEDEKSKYRRRR